MKKFKIALLSLTVLLAAQSYAQKESKKSSEGNPTLGVGLEAGVPVGDLSKGTSFGIGGSLKAGFPIFDGGDVTISAGYITFLGKKVDGSTEKEPSFGTIPLKAGLRFKLGEGFYGEPQLGYTIGKSSGEGAKSSGAFTYAAGVGYLVNNKIDLGLRYEASSKSEDVGTNKVTVTNGFIGLRVAYNFSL